MRLHAPCKLFGLLAIVASLLACESSNNSSSFDNDRLDRIQPGILSTSRSELDIEEPDLEFTFVFTELIDSSSILDGGVVLFTGEYNIDEDIPQERQIPITISIRDDLIRTTEDPVTGEPLDTHVTAITIKPVSGRYTLGERYKIRLMSTVKDLSTIESTHPVTGDLVQGNFLVSVDTEIEIKEGEWLLPDFFGLFAQGDDIREFETVRLDKHRTFLAGLVVEPGGLNKVWTAIFDIDTQGFVGNWGGGNQAVIILSDSSVVSGEPIAVKVVSNGFGAAAILWQQADALTDQKSLWLRYFDGQLWSPEPVQVASSTLADPLHNYAAEMLQNGNVAVAWEQGPVSDTQLRTRLFIAPTDTQPLEALAVVDVTPNPLSNINEAPNAKQPTLVAYLDSAALTWTQQIDGYARITQSFLNSDGTWQAPRSISLTSGAESLQNSSNPVLAFDALGNGFAAWQQYDGIRSNIWFSRFNSQQWTEQALAERNNAGDAALPTLTVTANGSAALAWRQHSNLDVFVSVREFSLERGWSEVEMLSSANDVNLLATLSLVHDNQNNFFLSWGEGAINQNYVSRFSQLEEEWSKLTTLTAASRMVRQSHLISIAGDGRTALFWTEFLGGVYRLAGALFDEPFDE